MLDKIKTLREIIEPKAVSVGQSFEEVLEAMDDDKRFDSFMKQLGKYISRKGLRADTKLSSLFLKSEFLDKCRSDFLIQNPKGCLKKYKNIVSKAFDNYVYDNSEWKSLRFIYSKEVIEDELERSLSESNFTYHGAQESERIFNLSKEFKYTFETYYIDENELAKIYELAKKILDKNNARSYDLHFCQNYSHLTIIDRLFHVVRIDTAHNYDMVWKSDSYKNMSDHIDFNDLSEDTKKYTKRFDKRRKEDPKINSNYAYTFDSGQWHSTKICDLKITNINELEIALNEYMKLVMKICLKNKKK